MLGSSAAKVGEGSGPEGPFRRLSVLLERRMVAHFGLVLPLGLLSYSTYDRRAPFRRSHTAERSVICYSSGARAGAVVVAAAQA